MGRFPQLEGQRGSLKWVQRLVNECPELINRPLRNMCMIAESTGILWLSPNRADEFAEYRDQAFLDLLGIQLQRCPLHTFWPRQGPQWDALARADSGEVFLVESKAHVSEMLSPGTKASVRSKIIINRSLKEVQTYLGIQPLVDWSTIFYQYTNRLAHLYLLRQLNDVPAFLVFLYFLGDREMDGPSTPEEWKSAIQVVKGVLGLREGHKLSKFVLDVFIDVSRIEKTRAGRSM